MSSLGADPLLGGKIKTGWELLIDLDWDLAVLQEARLPPGTIANLCRSHGWQCTTSQPDEDGKALCTIIAKLGHLTQSHREERCHEVLWSTAGHTIRVVNIYGPSGNAEWDVLTTGALARNAIIRAEAGGGGPSIIMGDFNTVFADLTCAFSFSVAGWQDLHTAGTCSDSTSQVVRRIDLLLANAGFRTLSRVTTVSWDDGFATHASQTITIDTERPGPAPMWCPAKALPHPLGPTALHDASAALPGMFAKAARTMAGTDIEAAWLTLTHCIQAVYDGAGLVTGPLTHRQGSVKSRRPGAALTPEGPHRC